MKIAKGFLKIIFTISILSNGGCLPSFKAKESGCGPGATFNPSTRLCTSQSSAPVGLTRRINLTEDVFSNVVLNYHNHPSQDSALDCEVDQATLVNVAEMVECSCAAGICTVGLRGFPNANLGTILYRFQDNNRVFGDYQTATVTMTPVNDDPTFCPVTMRVGAGNDCENRVSGEDWDCIAPGNPNTFSLGITPDFDFTNTLSQNSLFFYDQENKRCYYSDSTTNLWSEAATPNCQFTKNFGSVDNANCLGGDGDDCVGSGVPSVTGHQAAGEVYLRNSNRHCYYFDGSAWQDITGRFNQVISVDEDQSTNLSSLIQKAFDLEEGQLDFKISHDFTPKNGGTTTYGTISNCPGDDCQYTPRSNVNAAFNGTSVSYPGSNIDEFVLRAVDLGESQVTNSVAIIIKDVNDAPFIPNRAKTLIEGEIYNETFTLANTKTGNGSGGKIVDYDEGSSFRNFIFVADSSDPSRQSDCLSGNSIMRDLNDSGGGSGLAPFTSGSDGVFYCDTGNGVAQARFSGTNNNNGFSEVEIRFFPNINFTGQVKFKFTVEDSKGAISPTQNGNDSGLVSLTYTPLNDAPTFCQYSRKGHADCGFLGSGNSDNPGVDCLWNESPLNLSRVTDTSSSTSSVFPNHAGFPQEAALAGGAVFYDQRNDACYQSVASQWKEKDVQECNFSTDADDESDNCGAGNNCSGTSLPAGIPTVSGLIFYDTDDFTCHLSNQGVGWELIGVPPGATPTHQAHFVFKVNENRSGVNNQVTVDTTTLAKDPDGNGLSYSPATPPTNGTLTDCPGSSCAYRPNNGFVGFDSFTIEVSDGTASESVIVGIGVKDVNNPPTLTYRNETALNDTTVVVNEGALVQLFDLAIDEGADNSAEDNQQIQFDITSSNPTILSPTNIEAFWGASSDLYNKTTRTNLYTNRTAGTFNPLGDGTTDASSKNFALRFVTTPGVSGETRITIALQDNGRPAQSSSIEFTLRIEPFGASHGDWENVFGVGPLLRKAADRRNCDQSGERSSSANCGSGGSAVDCTASVNPNTDRTTYDPSAAGLVFFDSSSGTCFESSSENNLWAPRGCSFSKSQRDCNGNDCIGMGPPKDQTNYRLPPQTEGLRYLDVTNAICYKSEKGLQWTPEGSYIYLKWNGFVPLGRTVISGYKIFRRTRNFEYNYSAPVATISTSTTRTYTDAIGISNLQGYDPEKGRVLFYQVLPINARNEQLIFPQESFNEMTVVLPPYNMVMVPRRIVNEEICQHLHATPDRANNNRCSYKGIVNNYAANGHFDIASDLMMDRFEYGCDYTSSTVSDTDCGTVPNRPQEGLPCYGNQSPTTLGAKITTRTNAFYNRSNGICSINNGGNWVTTGSLNATQITQEFVSNLITSSAGMKGRLADLPPLTNISQEKAQEICAARTNSTTPIILENDSSDISLSSNAFRLPSRVEQVAMSAWDNETYTDSQISEMEKGSDLKASPKCNSSDADTISTFSDASVLLSPPIASLPGTASSSIRSLATGNDFTSKCASRYQIKSLIGNVREWSDEKFNCNFSDGCVDGDGKFSGSRSNANVIPSTATYYLDETLPSATQITGPTILMSTASWIIEEKDNDTAFFDFPAALPFSLKTQMISFPIGRTSGITVPQLRSDTFTVSSTQTADSAILYGGSYKDGTGAGRYYGNIQSATTTNSQTGFRCVTPINPSSY
ncbi:MAG: Ig-like domain-containing protein [Bacteriovoracales bacterium]|nr:Ig-like domain-containing protein [Bacteriovoracales bacterium]